MPHRGYHITSMGDPVDQGNLDRISTMLSFVCCIIDQYIKVYIISIGYIFSSVPKRPSGTSSSSISQAQTTLQRIEVIWNPCLKDTPSFLFDHLPESLIVAWWTVAYVCIGGDTIDVSFALELINRFPEDRRKFTDIGSRWVALHKGPFDRLRIDKEKNRFLTYRLSQEFME